MVGKFKQFEELMIFFFQYLQCISTTVWAASSGDNVDSLKS